MGIAERICGALLEFDENPALGRREILQAFEAAPMHFAANAAVALKRHPESAGAQFLVAQLISKRLLETVLVGPAGLKPNEAAPVLALARRVDPGYETRTLNELGRDAKMAPSLIRLLEVIQLSGQKAQAENTLQRMLKHPDPHIRSKAVLLLGRIHNSAAWVRERLGDPDIRSRANAIESLWGNSDGESVALFRAAAADKAHPRVAMNGLVGLHLCGETECLAELEHWAGSSDPHHRHTAFWAMGRLGDGRFLPFLASAMGAAQGEDRTRLFQTIRAIRTYRDSVQLLGTLQIHVYLGLTDLDGGRRIRFGVWESGRREILSRDALRATQCIVTEEQTSILRYQLQAETAGEGRLTFLWPQEAGGVWQAARDGAEGLRRDPAVFTWQTYANGCLPSSLSSAVAAAPPGSHLVLAAHPDEPLALPADLLAQARQGQARISAVLPEAAPSADALRIEQLCRDTGGSALRFDSEETLAHTVDAAIVGLQSVFELRYQAPQGESNDFPEVRLQILCEAGAGEKTFVLAPAPL